MDKEKRMEKGKEEGKGWESRRRGRLQLLSKTYIMTSKVAIRNT